MEKQNVKLGQYVTYKSCYSVGEVIAINNNMATLKLTATKEIVRKRISSLKLYEYQTVWGEQEMAAGQAKHNHGDTVYTCLSGDGNGCRMVWDDIKKECVDSKDFNETK